MLLSRYFFLRAVSGCYAVAFVSFYVQIPGLYGPEGVTPAVDRDIFPKLSSKLGLTFDLFLEFLSLIGAVISLWTSVFSGGQILFGILWLFYLILHFYGGIFLRSEILLIEAGLFSIFLSSGKVPNGIQIECLRWFIFRMIYINGVFKLLSGYPHWWNLAALPLHYESHCFPSVGSFYITNILPENFNEFGLALTFVFEITFPFLLYLPLKPVRKFFFFVQLSFVLVTFITGNFNVFNLLFIASILALNYDIEPNKFDKKNNFCFSFLIYFFTAFTFLFLLYFFITFLFNLRSMELKSELTSDDDLHSLISISCILGIMIGSICLLYNVLQSFFIKMTKSCCFLCGSMLYPTFKSLIPLSLFFASLLVFLPLFSPIQIVKKYSFINSYGSFEKMKQFKSRQEIILEGSYDYISWKEIDFYYKPGNVKKMPSYVLPYQPRLDWQMCLAALDSHEKHPWLTSLAYQLTQGNKKVSNLLNLHQSPFKNNPPIYVRGVLYEYKLVSKESKNENWWTRTLIDKDYLPVISNDSHRIISYLKHHKYLGDKVYSEMDLPLVVLLKLIRSIFENFESTPHLPVWTVSITMLPLLWKIFAKNFAFQRIFNELRRVINDLI